MSTNTQSETEGSRQFSTEMYFQTQKPPAGLDEKAKVVADFVTKWGKVPNKKVVLVTVSRDVLSGLIPSDLQSGGTTVPLEANT